MKNEIATNKSTESSQGDGGGAPPAPPSPPSPPELLPDNQTSRGGNTVLKSGPLFLSSKGIGWTSWKKRWFILTKTSLVFFRSDPSAIPQKGSEANFTLGGIDLNNSGSVVVKAEKKLLTVLFPDDRAFTLKAETLEDLHEWKTALEDALAQAPSAALVMVQNGIFKNEQADGANGSSEKMKDKQPAKSLVIGRPILLALEDVDGLPSFLEKALRFIEDHGVKVEGILRQAADVDDVMHRIQEYEQGKTEFSAGEDAHVIADCVKYFLRELPSPPVPASCCNALLEARRKCIGSDISNRVNAMRVAICETFPEPNRRLLQRILLMMQAVASHKTVNRMSTSAVAACMAPLLLRPLLGGECEIATDFDVGADGSMQLLQAAAAANHAQAIVITLLEEYQTIFSEGTMSPGLYSDSEEDESEDEEVTDDDEYYEDDGTQESDAYTEDDPENASNGSYSESGGSGEDDLSEDKGSDNCSVSTKSLEELDFEVKDQSSSGLIKPTLPLHDDTEISTSVLDQSSHSLESQRSEVDVSGDESPEITVGNKPTGSIQKSKTIANDPGRNSKRLTVLGRASAKKNLSMESIDFPVEEELEIQKLEVLKIDLQKKISEEVKGNTVMQANLEQRKRALHECRLALQKDVARLQDQLQKEREKRAILEAGLNTSRGRLPSSVMIDVKLKADLEEITQAEADVSNLTKKFDELSKQISQQHEQKFISMNDSREKLIHTSNHREIMKNRQKDTEDCAVPPLPGKSTSKDSPWEGAESRDGKKPESKSGKRGHEKQQQDSTRSSNSMSTASTYSKRSGTRTERGQQGTNSSSSALTKLTNRLNFLKEKRSQIANELQYLDKGRNPGQGLTSPGTDRGSDLPHSFQNLDKGRGPEVPSSSNVEKTRGSERPRSYENTEKGLQVEGQSSKDFEQNREVDGQLLPNNCGKQPQCQHLQIPDRGKSEGHVSSNSDRDNARGSSSKSVGTPKTKSR